MSLPQRQSSPAIAHSEEDDQSRSNIPRYDSIQGALGGRRVSQPVPLAYIRSHSDIALAQAHMPPDHRYSFPSSSSSATQNQQYPYEQHYPPSSYATPVYSHNSLPRMRTPHSLSDSSRTPVSQPPPPSYGLPPYLSYPPPSSQYAVPSGMPAPSWGAPPYSHYSQSPTDASVSPELVRVEPVPPVNQQDTGPYRTSDTSASTHVDTAPHISGSSSSRDLAPTESKGKQREGLPPIHRPRSSQEPDYHKLSETYRLLLDNANHSPTLASPLHALPSGLPSSDVLSRLYEFALEGVRQFDASEQGEPPPRSPSPQPRSSQQSKDDPGKGSTKRQRTDPSSAADSQKCMGCGATSTPEWRRGPLGPRTLCNACGLVYAKLIKKRGRVEAGRFIEGAASFATGAENVPTEFHHEFGSGVPSGSTGAQQPPYSQQDEDDRDVPPQGTSSAEGEGSEDDSYEDFPSQSGSRQQEGRR